MTGVSRTGQAALKDQYNGHNCMISGFSDTSISGDYCSPTECAHIIPSGLVEEKDLVRFHLRHCIYAVAYHFAPTHGGISSDPMALP